MKKNKKSTKENQVYYLAAYVLDSNPKMKKFDSFEKMGKFVKEFQEEHPDHMSIDSGDWIDFVITGIVGDVYFFTDGIELE
jgi:hypothetical protein